MKLRTLLTSVAALNLALINLPLKAESLSASVLDETKLDTPALHTSVNVEDFVILSVEESKQSETTLAPKALEEAKNSESWFKSTLKTTSGFVGVATLTDYLTTKGLDMVEGAVLSATGSTWIAKGIKVASYNTVYEIARDSSFIIGFKLPDILEKAFQSARNPKKVLTVLEETLKSGVRLGTTQVASYFLTQPTTELVGNAAYYATLFTTGSPLLAQGLYMAAKGAMHYTGVSNKLAKVIGYNAPEIIGGAVSTVSSAISSLKGWWSGSAVKTAPALSV